DRALAAADDHHSPSREARQVAVVNGVGGELGGQVRVLRRPPREGRETGGNDDPAGPERFAVPRLYDEPAGRRPHLPHRPALDVGNERALKPAPVVDEALERDGFAEPRALEV